MDNIPYIRLRLNNQSIEIQGNKMKNNPYKVEVLLSKLSRYQIKILQKIIFITHKRLTSQHMIVLDKLIQHINKKKYEKYDFGIPKHRLDRIMSEIYIASINSIHLVDNDFQSTENRFKQLDLLKKLNLEKFYEEQFKKFEKYIHKNKIKLAAEDFLNTYQFNKLNAINKKILLDREVAPQFKLDNYELDQFYWIEKMKIICEILNKQFQKKIKNKDPKCIADIEYISKYIKLSPLLEIYVLISIEFLEKNKGESQIESIYQKLLLITKQYSGREDLQTISHFLMNLCTNKSKMGNYAYRKILFDIINYLDKNNFILEKNIITTSLFKLCISTAVKEDKIQWANNFLKKYAPHIKDKNKDSILHYNQALIYFYEKKYVKVQNELNNFNEYEFDDLVIMNKKVLIIQVYFELWLIKTYNYDEHFFQSAFRSVITLLNRSTSFNDATYIKLKNFIKYSRKLYAENSKPALRSIYSTLQNLNENDVAQHDWLLLKFKQKIGR